MRFTLLAAAALLACAASAQTTPPVPAEDAVRTAAQKAISANPEVAARLKPTPELAVVHQQGVGAAGVHNPRRTRNAGAGAGQRAVHRE